jgi:hypothetical protein
MPKKPKTHTPRPALKKYYAIHPWRCEHKPEHSDIMAYAESSGTWEIIARVRVTSGHSAETLATFITNLVNDYQENESLLGGAVKALESILNEGWNFSTETETDDLLKRIKKIR